MTHLGFSYQLWRVWQIETNGEANFRWSSELFSYLEWNIIKVTEGPWKEEGRSQTVI